MDIEEIVTKAAALIHEQSNCSDECCLRNRFTIKRLAEHVFALIAEAGEVGE